MVFLRFLVMVGSLTISFVDDELGRKVGSSSRQGLSLPLTILYAKSDIAELDGMGSLREKSNKFKLSGDPRNSIATEPIPRLTNTCERTSGACPADQPCCSAPRLPLG